MQLEEIKAAVNAGRRVFWHHEGYEVIKGANDSWSILCHMNQNCIGLTHMDGVTMNGRPEEFKEIPNEETN